MTIETTCAKCNQPAVARRLCRDHDAERYARGRCRGPRPNDWGSRSKHPLYKTWTGTRRWTEKRHPAWDDFWRFVSDVGHRPSEHHRLERKTPNHPIGPDNFYWRRLLAPEIDRSTHQGKAAHMRAWRTANPKAVKRYDLKRRFNITDQVYDVLLSKQGGKCAICNQEDPHFSLAVDHCHRTNAVRGLLCGACNLGLGKFSDDPDRLEAAAAYLRSHKRLKAA